MTLPLFNHRYHLPNPHITDRPNGSQKADIRQYKSLNWLQSLFIATVKFDNTRLNKTSAKKYLLRNKEQLLLVVPLKERDAITDQKLRRLSNAQVVEYLNHLKNYAPYRAPAQNPVRSEPPRQQAPAAPQDLPAQNPAPAQNLFAPRPFEHPGVPASPQPWPRSQETFGTQSDWFARESAKLEQEFLRERPLLQSNSLLSGSLLSVSPFPGTTQGPALFSSTPLQRGSFYSRPTHSTVVAHPSSMIQNSVAQPLSPQITTSVEPLAAPSAAHRTLSLTSIDQGPFRTGSNPIPTPIQTPAPIQPLPVAVAPIAPVIAKPQEKPPESGSSLSSKEHENQPKQEQLPQAVTAPVVTTNKEPESSTQKDPSKEKSPEKTVGSQPSPQLPKASPPTPKACSDSDEDPKRELFIGNLPPETTLHRQESLATSLNELSSQLRVVPEGLKKITREILIFPLMKKMIYPEILKKIVEKDRNHPELEPVFNRHLNEWLDIVEVRVMTDAELERLIDKFKNHITEILRIQLIAYLTVESIHSHHHEHTLTLGH